jgi:hypothetical protein
MQSMAKTIWRNGRERKYRNRRNGENIGSENINISIASIKSIMAAIMYQ